MCVRSLRFVYLLVACLAVCIALHSQPAFAAEPPNQVTQQPEWEVRIEAALDATGDWEFEDSALSDVCALMQEKLNIDVAIDKRSLEDNGIDSNTPITLFLSGVSNRSFLRLMLRDLDLTYTMRFGALWITTPEEADANLITKVYPVGDLLVRDTTLGDHAADDKALIEVITNSILPDSWDFLGGPGSIRGIYEALVVSHTSEVHEEVEQFLTTYRMVIANDSEGDDSQSAVFMLGAGDNSSLQAALDKPLTANFEDVALKDAIDFMSKAMSIPIVMDVRALEEFGLDLSTPINMSFAETRLRFALVRMLHELDLAYTLRDEVLLITTPEEAEAQLLTGLYSVRDLVEIGDASAIDPASERYDFKSLISLIEAMVFPDTWDTVGGPSSVNALLPVPAIVISQTQEAHDEISELLTKVRAAKKLAARSAAANDHDDPAALFVRSYPILAAYSGPDEISKLVIRASETGTWNDEAGTFVQGLGISLVVKHNASGHRQVQRLLTRLGVWSPAVHKGPPVSLGGGISGSGQPAESGAGVGHRGFF